MGQALRYVLFLTFESMILECEQSLFFFQSTHEGLACVASVSVWFRSKKRPWKGIFGLIAREIKREPKNKRGSLTLAPLFFLLNRTETLATQANEG